MKHLILAGFILTFLTMSCVSQRESKNQFMQRRARIMSGLKVAIDEPNIYLAIENKRRIELKKLGN